MLAPTARVPRDPAVDSSLAFLREGYAFIPNRARRFRTDVFETRIMGTRATCVTGPDAARMFYGEAADRFTRVGAIPLIALTLLQDIGSVMTLDRDAHAHRKRMYADVMAPASAAAIADAFERRWRAAEPSWRGREISLYEAGSEVLLGAACDWAGVPLDSSEVRPRARLLAMMVAGAGSPGWPNLRGHLAHQPIKRWMRRVVERFRADRRTPAGSIARRFARFRDEGSALLPAPVAAKELINITRPVVATARYLCFAALALHRHPAWRARLRGDSRDAWNFALEVRRFYPFIPMIGGRALAPFTWRDHRFAAGAWVLFDLWGTQRDPRLWAEPDRFDPDRFRGWRSEGFDLVSHGAGDARTNHRCPGEDVTTALIARAARLLAELDYRVPAQDLTVPLDRIPAMPRSGFRMAVA